MKNVQVENFIKKEKKELLVSAKEEIRKGVLGINIRLKAQFVDLPSHISLEKQQELIKISEENRKEFPQEFLNQELEGREITEFYRGTNSLLPTRFRRFYQECVKVSTKGLTIYFTDLAIEKFQTMIAKLERRSLSDGFQLVSDCLEKEDVINMSLSVSDGTPFLRGRSFYYEKGNDSLLDSPRYTAYYHTDENEDGTIHPEEIANMEDIISLFAQQNGGFSSMRWNDKECVAYNRGSIYVTGIDKAPQLKEKIYRYMKRNNEMFTLPTSGEEK